jgi:gas vesicle structural protein
MKPPVGKPTGSCYTGGRMAVATRASGTYVDRPHPSGLAEVVDLILDKGLVIDAYVRVSLVGIEVLTIDARIVIASVDTYLRFAEAVNRLDLAAQSRGLPDMIGDMEESGSERKVKGALEGAKESVKGKKEEKEASRSG